MVEKKLSFGEVKIQKLNRIALPSYLLNNLKLSIGSEVELFIDIQNKEIVISKNLNKKISLHKRITFGKTKIQKLNRISLNSSLLDNVDLKVGNNVKLFLDFENEEIIIKNE